MDKTIPLYLQTKKWIKDSIAAGRWKSGDKLPSIKALAVLCGNVSVGTVRRALDELVTEDRLRSRQGSGHVVTSFADGNYWNRFQRFEAKNGRLCHFTSRVLLFERIEADAEVARALELNVGEEVIHVFREMSSEEGGEGYDELYLNAEIFHKITPQGLSLCSPQLSLYAYYESKLGVSIASARDTVEATIGFSHPQIKKAKKGPFLRLRRISRSLSGKVCELRLESVNATAMHLRFNS